MDGCFYANAFANWNIATRRRWHTTMCLQLYALVSHSNTIPTPPRIGHGLTAVPHYVI